MQWCSLVKEVTGRAEPEGDRAGSLPEPFRRSLTTTTVASSLNIVSGKTAVLLLSKTTSRPWERQIAEYCSKSLVSHKYIHRILDTI